MTGLIAMALLASSARNASAQTPGDEIESEVAQEDLRDAEITAKQHRAELMKIPHVRVVTAEMDPRKDAVILIEVDDPKNVDSVMRQVPSKLEGFPVEVDEGRGDDDNDLVSVNGGHWGDAAPTPTPFPTIDKYGYHHHTWLKPSAPATNPDAQP